MTLSLFLFVVQIMPMPYCAHALSGADRVLHVSGHTVSCMGVHCSGHVIGGDRCAGRDGQVSAGAFKACVWWSGQVANAAGHGSMPPARVCQQQQQLVGSVRLQALLAVGQPPMLVGSVRHMHTV